MAMTVYEIVQQFPTTHLHESKRKRYLLSPLGEAYIIQGLHRLREELVSSSGFGVLGQEEEKCPTWKIPTEENEGLINSVDRHCTRIHSGNRQGGLTRELKATQ